MEAYRVKGHHMTCLCRHRRAAEVQQLGSIRSWVISTTLRTLPQRQGTLLQIIEECYNRVPKSTVSCELKEQSVKQWQNEWERSTKGAITKSFFPNIVDRLKLRINAAPNFTAIVTGHGNIKPFYTSTK
jgi:hypothetical protein